MEQKLQRAEEALQKAGSEAEGPSNQEIYQQGFRAAVHECEEKAQPVITREVNAAVARRNAELLSQLNIEVENAVARGKEPLQAELNERAATAESRAANNANAALTEALQRATTAKATLEKAQSSLENIKQKASDECLPQFG